jgi:hypothetical protein
MIFRTFIFALTKLFFFANTLPPHRCLIPRNGKRSVLRHKSDVAIAVKRRAEEEARLRRDATNAAGDGARVVACRGI